MRFSVLRLLLASCASTAFVIGACSDPAGIADDPVPGDPDGAANEGGGPNADGAAGQDGATGTDGGGDGGTGQDGDTDGSTNDATVEAGVDAGTPAVQLIGRFDTGDAVGPRSAWPGTRIVARFNGTDATVRLSRTHDGFRGGPSWFNVIVDDVVQAPFSVSGIGQDTIVAAGLPLGDHKVEIEKRTEANHGTVRFDGFTFAGGTGLLPPPARPTRRIEWLAESTIDGFGVEGDRTATCVGTAPPQFDNVRKSLAAVTSASLSAEAYVTAYSGKGIADTSSGLGADPLTYPLIFPRALPDPGAGTAWTFAAWTPDVIVISLGGVDYRNGISGVKPDFRAKYDALVADIRAKYGAAPYIFLTVWSQIKDLGGNANARSSLGGHIDAVIATRAGLGDAKVYKFVFPEANVNTDETGCFFHANAAHHTNMAALLTTEIQAKVGW